MVPTPSPPPRRGASRPPHPPHSPPVGPPEEDPKAPQRPTGSSGGCAALLAGLGAQSGGLSSVPALPSFPAALPRTPPAAFRRCSGAARCGVRLHGAPWLPTAAPPQPLPALPVRSGPAARRRRSEIPADPEAAAVGAAPEPNAAHPEGSGTRSPSRPPSRGTWGRPTAPRPYGRPRSPGCPQPPPPPLLPPAMGPQPPRRFPRCAAERRSETRGRRGTARRSQCCGMAVLRVTRPYETRPPLQLRFYRQRYMKYKVYIRSPALFPRLSRSCAAVGRSREGAVAERGPWRSEPSSSAPFEGVDVLTCRTATKGPSVPHRHRCERPRGADGGGWAAAWGEQRGAVPCDGCSVRFISSAQYKNK